MTISQTGSFVKKKKGRYFKGEAGGTGKMFIAVEK